MANVWEWFRFITELFTSNEKLIINYACYFNLFVAVVTFLNGRSPYGRHSYNQSYGIPANVAWFFIEIPSVLIPAMVYYFSTDPLIVKASLTSVLPLSLYVIHYFNRSMVYSQRIKGAKPFPLSAIPSAVAFVIMNGYIQSRYLLAYPTKTTIASPHFVAGMAVAVVGFVINLHSDNILIGLRKSHDTGYKIPRGGLFEYVSCANFFGEVLEWSGFALATWNLAGFTFAVFSFGNLYPRARQHHRFYLEKFKDYPKNRKIIFPYLL